MPGPLPPKMVPWLAPIELAAHRYGIERCLLFGILDKETLCATSPRLDKPGPGGTGDFEPRQSKRYAARADLLPLLRHWQPLPDEFRRLFPKVLLKSGEPTPDLCMPRDGMGWGRGGFQIDFAAHTDWCLERKEDGSFLWEDPKENADKAALILGEAILAFNHDEWLAASAYNCGIENVRRALLTVTEPASLEKRHAAADQRTTGHNYASDVMRRRREFRRLLNQSPEDAHA